VAIAAVGTTAVFNVALNLVLIPRYSFVGASAATVASEILCFGLLFTLFRRGVPRVGLARVAWRPMLAGAGLAALLALIVPRMPAGIGWTAGAALAAAGTYGVLLAALGAIGREDLQLVRDLKGAGR